MELRVAKYNSLLKIIQNDNVSHQNVQSVRLAIRVVVLQPCLQGRKETQCMYEQRLICRPARINVLPLPNPLQRTANRFY